MVDGITDGQEFAQGGGDEVTWSATDATSGVRIVRVRLDGVIIDRDLPAGGPFVPGSLEPGSYELFVRAHDVAGNAVTQRLDFTVVAPDTTAPTIAVAGVTDGGTYGDSRVLHIATSASDTESDISRFRVWLDGTRIHDGGDSFEVDLPLWELDLGAHTLEVVAVDAAGNRRTTILTFTVGTSIEDVWTNLDRFTAGGSVTSREATAVTRQLRLAERHLDRGRTAQARTALQRARDQARDIADVDARDLLVRDLTELVRDTAGDGVVPDTSRDATANARALARSSATGPLIVEAPDFLDRD